MTSTARTSYTVIIDQPDQKQAVLSLLHQLNKSRNCYCNTESRYHIERFLENLWIPGTRLSSCYNFISGCIQNQEVLLLRPGMYDKNQMLPFMKQVKPKPIPAWLATEFTVVILKPLLFGSHLANIDPHTDDFSCLHANRARGLPVPSCSCVEG